MRSFGFGFWMGFAAAVVLAWLLQNHDQSWDVELPTERHLAG